MPPPPAPLPPPPVPSSVLLQRLREATNAARERLDAEMGSPTREASARETTQAQMNEGPAQKEQPRWQMAYAGGMWQPSPSTATATTQQAPRAWPVASAKAAAEKENERVLERPPSGATRKGKEASIPPEMYLELVVRKRFPLCWYTGHCTELKRRNVYLDGGKTLSGTVVDLCVWMLQRNPTYCRQARRRLTATNTHAHSTKRTSNCSKVEYYDGDSEVLTQAEFLKLRVASTRRNVGSFSTVAALAQVRLDQQNNPPQLLEAECKHVMEWRSTKKEDSGDANEKDDGDDDGFTCAACGSGDHGHVLILCDRCDTGYHIHCLNPPLAEVPKGDWFCPSCTAATLKSDQRGKKRKASRPAPPGTLSPAKGKRQRRKSATTLTAAVPVAPKLWRLPQAREAFGPAALPIRYAPINPPPAIDGAASTSRGAAPPAEAHAVGVLYLRERLVACHCARCDEAVERAGGEPSPRGQAGAASKAPIVVDSNLEATPERSDANMPCRGGEPQRLFTPEAWAYHCGDSPSNGNAVVDAIEVLLVDDDVHEGNTSHGDGSIEVVDLVSDDDDQPSFDKQCWDVSTHYAAFGAMLSPSALVSKTDAAVAARRRCFARWMRRLLQPPNALDPLPPPPPAAACGLCALGVHIPPRTSSDSKHDPLALRLCDGCGVPFHSCCARAMCGAFGDTTTAGGLRCATCRTADHGTIVAREWAAEARQQQSRSERSRLRRRPERFSGASAR